LDEAWEEFSETVFQTVRLGSRVLLQDESGAEALYTITSSWPDGHLNGGRRQAPAIARALLGRRVGEEVHVWTSSGAWRVTILEVD
jgi:transcription elongation GreA/GreB family factor